MSVLDFRKFSTSLLLILSVPAVLPGANDLHFYDGTSPADIISGDVFFEILDPPELRYSYRIRPAKDFGATFNESLSFQGALLVPTIPLHSCSDIVNQEDIIGHIALSERGECSFVYKAAKAQQAGARAVIITEFIDKGDDSLDHLIEMVDDNECSFVYKAAKAQQAGARAVIITEFIDKGDDSLDHLIEMVDDKMELDVNIPAAFLLGRSGATILLTLKRLRRKEAIINLPVNMTHVAISKMNQPPWIAW